MRTLLKVMSGVALILVGGYSYAHTLGMEVHKYECEGMLTVANVSTSSTLHLRIEQNGRYLPWSEGQGTVRVDTPSIGTFYYRIIDSTDDPLKFSEAHLGTGTLKDLGKNLDVPLGEGRTFSGRCREPGR